MIRRYVFLAVVGVVVVSAITPASVFSTVEEKPAPTLAEQVRQLQARISQLESRIAALEKSHSHTVPKTPLVDSTSHQPPRIWLKSRSEIPLIMPEENQSGTLPLLPYIGPTRQRPPKVWGEGEINGQVFYIVPLADDATR
jgi:outer membrane murein-binding lipoprotein Lpp